MRDLTEARAIADEILRQIAARGPGKSICPSEVARALASDWRALMPAVRDVARQLRDEGRLDVTQRGKVITGDWRGPVRLRLPS